MEEQRVFCQGSVKLPVSAIDISEQLTESENIGAAAQPACHHHHLSSLANCTKIGIFFNMNIFDTFISSNGIVVVMLWKNKNSGINIIFSESRSPKSPPGLPIIPQRQHIKRMNQVSDVISFKAASNGRHSL